MLQTSRSSAGDGSAALAAPHPSAPLVPLAPLADGGLRLTDWGVITATGPEAATFLHGQLTQDVQHLPADRARLAGYCSAKGRLLATFVMWQRGPEEIALACSADLLPATLKRLSMFVLRAKCRLADASATLAVHGLVGRAATSDAASLGVWSLQAEGAAHRIRLPDAQGLARALWVGPADALPPAAGLAAERWAALEVASGVPRVVAATADQFVPQMVNLELTGGVNFQKGCYPGQEVVARSQYRGTLKRRMFRLACPDLLAPGTEVFHDSDPEQPAGMVVLCAPTGEGAFEALVELKVALTATAGRLHAAGADLRLLTLPYSLPSEPG